MEPGFPAVLQNQPFFVWTDPKNLEYLQSAKHLNARQTRWALFFNRFNFTLAYRPGTKNCKADALCSQHDTTEDNPPPDLILPLSSHICVTRTDIER